MAGSGWVRRALLIVVVSALLVVGFGATVAPSAGRNHVVLRRQPGKEAVAAVEKAGRGHLASLTSADTASGQYVAVTPYSLVDTRSGTQYDSMDTPVPGQAQVTGTAAATVTVTVAGNGIPSSGVLAANLEVIAMPTSDAPGSFTVWPSDQPRPTAGFTEYDNGDTSSNEGLVQLSAAGQVSFYNSGVATNLVVFVYGYVLSDSASGQGGGYTPLTQSEVVDTRTGLGGYSGEISRSMENFTLAGQDGIPTSGVADVAIDVRTIDPSADGNLQLWPTGNTEGPAAAVDYFTSGESSAEMVTTTLGTGGAISVETSGPSTDLAIDVFGYYTASGSGSVFVPIDETSVLKTTSPVAASTTTPVSVTMNTSSSSGASVVPDDATAVLVNLIAWDTASASWVDAWPAGSARPSVNQLYTDPSDDTGAEAIIAVGTDGQIDVMSGSSTDLQVDVYGYFQVPSGPNSSGEMTGGSNPSETDITQPSTAAGDPATDAAVDDATGELDLNVTDDSIPGNGLPLDLTRTYGDLNAASDGPLGYGWSDSYAMSVTVVSGVATVTQENGSTVVFDQNGSGEWVPASRVDATLNQAADGTWSFTRDATGDTYSFNSNGQLTAETDLDGYTTTLAYDSAGELATVTDPAGRQLSFGWGACGAGQCVTSVTDPGGRTINYTYDSAGDLSGVQDVGGAWTYYSYNTSHQLTGITDADGNTTNFTYSAIGRVLTETDPDGNATGWSYTLSSGETGATTLIDPDGYQIVYTLSEGQLASETQASGTTSATTTTYAYDPVNDGVVTETTAAGTSEAEMTSYAYNDDGDNGGSTADLTSETNAAGTSEAETTSATYDQANEPLTETDADGYAITDTYSGDGDLTTSTQPITSTVTDTTTYSYVAPGEPGSVVSGGTTGTETTTSAYDSYGDLISSTDPDGDTTTYTYNALGEKTSMVAPNGNVSGANASAYTTTYSYDAYGKVIKTVGPDGVTTAATYDPDGNQLTSTDADGNTTTNTYNGDGDLTKTVQPDGTAITYAYDGDGHRTSETDADGNTTTWTYDPLGNELSETQPGGQTTTWTYDLNGNQTSETDPDGNTTTYTYNRDNELTSTTEPDGTVVSSAYDADGNQISYADGAENTTIYAYNDDDQLASQTLPGGQETTYTYNDNGNQTSETDPADDTTTTTYNGDNQPISVTYSDGTHALSYTYDADGNLTAMTDATGTTTYTYNAANQLTTETDGAGATISYSYDPDGNVTGIVYPNGKSVTDTYNKMNELASVTDWAGNTTNLGYDPDGNQTTITYPSGITDTRTYNSSDQLTRITDTNSSANTIASFNYTLDADGDITAETDTGVASPGTATYTYDSDQELTGYTAPSGSAQSYTYDAAKDLTTSPTGAAQAYNSDDQLCWTGGATVGTCANPPAGATTDTYNANGDLTTVTPPTGSATSYTWNEPNQLTTSTPASGDPTTYTYNGTALLQNQTTGTDATTYTWDTQASIPRLLTDGTNYYIYANGPGPIEQVNAATGTPSYLLSDQLGSVRALSDQSGDITGTYTYNPWGALTSQTGTATTPFGYAGYYNDTATGLYYLQARWYNPSTGQFLSTDPDVQTTESSYGYANDNPVATTDPTGEFTDYCRGTAHWIPELGIFGLHLLIRNWVDVKCGRGIIYAESTWWVVGRPDRELFGVNFCFLRLTCRVRIPSFWQIGLTVVYVYVGIIDERGLHEVVTTIPPNFHFS